ncbi:hypothetical protein PRUB_b0023 [Pseudoalteromonas rubra]|uniref:Uncharacterized protein n=1 Tax=Pseudoalteromonas rubra TaxID=43658 RepID=A0A8T0C133_9GAMM|nr:hypothetical protein PRUB_b0023 [Pseudoalteromonas rubra]
MAYKRDLSGRQLHNSSRKNQSKFWVSTLTMFYIKIATEMRRGMGFIV